MDWKFNRLERYVIVFACVMIITLGLTGCANKTIMDPDLPIVTPTEPTVQEPTRAETRGRMPAIVDALGCMFAPQSCGENTDK